MDLIELGANPAKKQMTAKICSSSIWETGAGKPIPYWYNLLLGAGIDPAEEDASGNSALRAKRAIVQIQKKVREMLIAASDQKKALKLKPKRFPTGSRCPLC
jgi:hypothetical protein